MSEYLIQDTTLDAIADAINAKTGGSSAMTPAEMVTAIGSISGGGGGGMKLLADYTATEDVSAIRIDFTSAMQGYDIYMVVLELESNKSNFPCIGVNEEPGTTYYLPNFPANTRTRRVTNLIQSPSLTGWSWNYLAARNKTFSAPISFFKIASYYSDGVFLSGSSVKIYGGKIQ